MNTCKVDRLKGARVGFERLADLAYFIPVANFVSVLCGGKKRAGLQLLVIIG